MKGRHFLILLLASALLLSGCTSWMEGSFVSVTPHAEVYNQGEADESEEANNYHALIELLTRLIEGRVESASVDVSRYEGDLERQIPGAIHNVRTTDPLAAYAVRDISITTAEVGARRIATVKIYYTKSKNLMQSIDTAWGVSGVESRVHAALSRAQTSLTLRVNGYEAMDLKQIVESYYQEHLDTVMECPLVEAQVYPNLGNTRILDITFQYTQPQQTLLDMAEEVKLMLSSASGYVRGQETELAKAERLNSFLRPMFTELGTTSTPVYSLLYQGIGDCHSVATVFGLLCREVGLNCWVVSGAKGEENCCWNILKLDGAYYHADLLQSWQTEGPLLRYDDEMTDYSWDIEAYPACPRPMNPEIDPTTGTEPGTEPAETDAPSTEPSEEHVTESTTEPLPITEPPPTAEPQPTEEVTEP